MALTEKRFAALLAYCRLTEAEEEEQELVRGMYASAVAYLGEAGVKEPSASSARRAQFDQCVNYLVLDAYDRRDAKEPSADSQENVGFRRLLNQLKLTEPPTA